MDAADTEQTGVACRRRADIATLQLCSESSLWSRFFFVSCRFASKEFSPRRMFDVLVSSSCVSELPVSCLRQSTYTSALRRCIPIFPLLSIVPNFPFPASSEPCVFLHSFLQFLLSWGIFASCSPLDSPATNILTRGGTTSAPDTRFSLCFR